MTTDHVHVHGPGRHPDRERVDFVDDTAMIIGIAESTETLTDIQDGATTITTITMDSMIGMVTIDMMIGGGMTTVIDLANHGNVDGVEMGVMAPVMMAATLWR